MDTIETSDDMAVVRLSGDEIRTVNNALNEVLNGPDAIEEREFETRLGVTRNFASTLLRAIRELPKAG